MLFQKYVFKEYSTLCCVHICIFSRLTGWFKIIHRCFSYFCRIEIIFNLFHLALEAILIQSEAASICKLIFITYFIRMWSLLNCGRFHKIYEWTGLVLIVCYIILHYGKHTPVSSTSILGLSETLLQAFLNTKASKHPSICLMLSPSIVQWRLSMLQGPKQFTLKLD